MNKKTLNYSGELGLKFVAVMEQITMDRIGDIGIANARDNVQYLNRGKNLKALREESLGEGNCALIIAAGPSLKRHNVAPQLKKSGYDGAIIATDSALRYCLHHKIVPDLIVTLDPHAKRIVRWFGDRDLKESDLRMDDYFSRQDMDSAFADELRANHEIIELIDRYGKQMRIALSTSTSKSVVNRVLETGMKIYWWNPMYDDPDAPNSLTRRLYDLNGLPSVNAGGNAGTACWMMAHAVLGKRHVALTGVDFSYYDGTPYKNTQYYYEARDLVGEDNLDQFFIRVYNPYLKKWFYTDPAYMWYREIFLEMAKETECVTSNCTEGGILFGDPIRFISLDNFLNEMARTKQTVPPNNAGEHSYD